MSSPDRVWTPRKNQGRQATLGSSASHLPTPPQSPTHARSKSLQNIGSRSYGANPSVALVVGEASQPQSPTTPRFQLLEVPIPHYRLGVPQVRSSAA